MFAVEFITSRPASSAPYYSLVVREAPYTIGSLASSDVSLPLPDISEFHATLEVLRSFDANDGGHTTQQQQQNNDDGVGAAHATMPQPSEEEGLGAADADVNSHNAKEDEDDAVVVEAAEAEQQTGAITAAATESQQAYVLEDKDPLVVRLTALHTKGASIIRVNGAEVAAGDVVVMTDGAEVEFGGGSDGAAAGTTLVLHYRPLVVSIDTEDFPEDYTRDLAYMFRTLGATLCDVQRGPAMHLAASVPLPIARLHCVAELRDSKSGVTALAAGYSVVQPAYVFEWFAALAQAPTVPLSALPAPCSSEVPVRSTLHTTSGLYVRPESDTCPFSLYPLPLTATKKRDREGLFADRHFYFMGAESADKYKEVLTACGGSVYTADDEYMALEALRSLVDAQQEQQQQHGGDDGVDAQRPDTDIPFPENFYIMVDGPTEAAMLNDGVRQAQPALLQFLQQAVDVFGATRVPVMGDHSLFTSLLCNAFCYEPIHYSVDLPVAALSLPLSSMPNHAAGGVNSTYHYHSQQHQQQTATTPSSVGQNSPRGTQQQQQQRRRASLLPRTENRTPSRSQLRSASRHQTPTAEGGAMSGRSRSQSRGRRHIRVSVRPKPLSIGERFDILRVRVYAFLVREEARLDEGIASCQRNRYVSRDLMEHALECKAQAEEYMTSVDDLLDEPGCGPYADSLRRFWRDCSDLDMKAAHLVSSWDNQCRSSSTTRGARSSRSRSRKPTTATAAGSARSYHESSDAAVQNSNSGNYYNTAQTPRSSSRPATPRVREHRDMYLSIEAQQRLSTSQRLTANVSAADEGIDSVRVGDADDAAAAAATPRTHASRLPPTPRGRASPRKHADPNAHTSSSSTRSPRGTRHSSSSNNKAQSSQHINGNSRNSSDVANVVRNEQQQQQESTLTVASSSNNNNYSSNINHTHSSSRDGGSSIPPRRPQQSSTAALINDESPHTIRASSVSQRSAHNDSSAAAAAGSRNNTPRKQTKDCNNYNNNYNNNINFAINLNGNGNGASPPSRAAVPARPSPRSGRSSSNHHPTSQQFNGRSRSRVVDRHNDEWLETGVVSTKPSWK